MNQNIRCALCSAWLPNSSPDALREHRVLKLGELQYIELAHVGCAELDNNVTPGYWK